MSVGGQVCRHLGSSWFIWFLFFPSHSFLSLCLDPVTKIQISSCLRERQAYDSGATASLRNPLTPFLQVPAAIDLCCDALIITC